MRHIAPPAPRRATLLLAAACLAAPPWAGAWAALTTAPPTAGQPATPPQAGQQATPQAAQSAPPQAAQQAAFDLNEIRVDGNTVLPQDKIEELVYPFLGPGRTPADVTAARKALTDAYNDAGYKTVSVGPPRWVDRAGGVIGIAVTERTVGRLRVTHAKYFLPSLIRQQAPSLAPGKVPNFNQVRDDLMVLNAYPDRTVAPSLHAGRVPGTVDVDLDVDDKLPLHGTVEVNNRYNAFTHSLRTSATLTDGNLFQRGDSATISYSVAPESVKDSEIESASYLFHIPDSRLSLLVSYLHSDSNIIALGTTDVAGRGDTAGFRLLIPAGTEAAADGSSFTHSFSVGWDYKRFYELDTFKTTHTLTSAPVTFYPLSAAYQASWASVTSQTDLSLSAELGVNHLGSNSAEFDNKRYNADGGFSLIKASLTRTQYLPHDIQLWGTVLTQETNSPLVSSEQFALGGVDTVRGYLESETLGDYGIIGQSELRSPDLKTWLKGPVNSWRFHVFADTGVVGLRDVEAGQRSSYGLSSAGIGTRVNLWGYLNGQVQDATAFNHGPNTKAGTNRVLFRVYGEF